MTSIEAPPTFLLLLPPSPSPPTLPALKTAYGETLSEVLKEVASASLESDQAAVLEIALACPHLVSNQSQSRASIYQETQSILAAVYKLVCLIATADNVNIEDSDGVDVRILPVAWDPDASIAGLSSSYGPVVTLSCLAASQRQWQYAFGVEGEQGEALVRAFVAAKQNASQTSGTNDLSVRTGRSNGPQSNATSTASRTDHSHVAVGGTFDHIHLGHKLLLTMTAFLVDPFHGEHALTIGITNDALLQNKKHAEQLESWNARQESTHRFLAALIDFAPPSASQARRDEVHEPGPNGHVINISYPSGLTIKYAEISDPFGPTITIEAISALIISGETRSGGQAVNDKRAEKGWSALDVFEVDVLDATEDTQDQAESSDAYASKLSSTEIRRKLAEKQSKL